MTNQAPTTWGLTAAHNIADANGVRTYSPAAYLDDSKWWGVNAKAPANTQWSAPGYEAYAYQGYDAGKDPSFKAYSQAAPDYQGLSGGDYGRLELNLRAPGELAAKNAYESALRELSGSATARGLYGSSQFTRQMDQQANRAYMDALTSNAASAAGQRYSLEAQDRQFGQAQRMQAWQSGMDENTAANQLGYSVWRDRLSENQQRNDLLQRENAAANQWAWDASVAGRDWSDLMATRQADFQNALAMSRQQWDQERLEWETAQNDAAWDRIFQTWGNLDPEIEHYEKKMLKNQVRSQEDESGLGGILSSAGSLAGGLIGLLPGAGSVGGIISAGSRLAGSFF